MESCYGLYNKVEGLYCEQDDGYPRYSVNGNCFKLRFKGINSKMGKFEIVSAENSPLGGVNNTFTSKVTKAYGGSEDPKVEGTNLFYSPIPFEFFKSYEEKP